MELLKGFFGGVVAAALVATLALVARADNDTHIHACVDDRGRPRIVADGTECTPRETALEWNIAGPPGPQGEIGSQGPQGEPGPTAPGWDTTLPADDGGADGCNSSRFTCVLDDMAVRDN